MFAGIVEGLGRVVQIAVTADGARLLIEVPYPKTELSIGCSIAVNGVCLTAEIIDTQDNEVQVTFTAVNETLRKTNLGALLIGSRVNTERSLLVGGRVDGHFVSGHVDGTALLKELSTDGSATALWFETVPELMAYIAPKGSVTINGVSLTVGAVSNNSFQVYIIPHTAVVTNLGTLSVNDVVNIEVDTVARYVVHYLRGNAQVVA